MEAFKTDGTYSGAALIANLYSKTICDTVYTNQTFFGATAPDGSRLFRAFVQKGDSAYRYVVRRGSNESVQLFTEGQAQPATDSQKFANIANSWVYVRAMCQLWRTALDALQSYRAGRDVLDQEIAFASLDVADLLNVTLLGSTYGLEAAIDSSTSWGGVTRGSASWFESREVSVGAILAAQDMLDMLEALKDNDRGARGPFAILMPWNQTTRLYQVGGAPAIQQTSDADKAPSYFSQTFAGQPVYGIGDMTDTIALFLDRANDNLQLPIIRAMDTFEMSPSGDSRVFQISTGCTIAVRSPKTCGKLASLTA